jgi:hypothetical protein
MTVNPNNFRTSESSKSICNKGWTVHTAKNRNWPFTAMVKGKFCGSFLTKQEAVHQAVGIAHKEGCLNWSKSLRWCKLEGIELLYEDFFNVELFTSSKGWYVSKCKNSWQVLIGTSHATANYVCSRINKKIAIKKAMEESKQQGFYNKINSDAWLKRSGFENLIEY